MARKRKVKKSGSSKRVFTVIAHSRQKRGKGKSPRVTVRSYKRRAPRK